MTALRIEFPADVVADSVSAHHGASLSYHFALYVWRP